ncbi:hypothetical protein ACOSQ3_020432 [Xanthoceras sorbifolium]
MDEEYGALIKNHTWTLVPPPPNCNIVGHKWVFRIKYNVDGSISKYKARLVAKGFHQTPGVDFSDTFSPVIKPSTIRVIFTLAATFGWKIQQVDVNNAFLNGELEELAFMGQPSGFTSSSHPSHVCRLNKALYGLKQTPRAWFHKLKSALVEWRFVNSTSDVSLFIKKVGVKVVYVLIYVDDILITGNDPSLIHTTINFLNSKFALKTLGQVHYFLGFKAFRNSDGIYLTQTKYVHDLLAKTNMLNAKPCSTPICSSVKLSAAIGSSLAQSTVYRSVIGALQYLTYTRPDINFAVSRLSQFLSSPNDIHWQACKRILRYLKGTSSLGLVFRPATSLHLKAFADADWASCVDDRRSTSGCCVFLGPNLINWYSRK